MMRLIKIALLTLFLVGLSIRAFAAQWIQSAAQDGIAYFAFSSPKTIQRFDMRTQTWLSPISLGLAPQAFTVDSEAIYVSYGFDIVKMAHDGSGESLLLNVPDGGWELAVAHDYLFIMAGLTHAMSVNKHTGEIIDQRYYSYSMHGLSVAPSLNRIFGRTTNISPPDIVFLQFDSNGALKEQSDSPYHQDFFGGFPTWVFPGEAQVVDPSGVIYDTNDLHSAHGFGTSFDDISFHGDLPIVLRDRTLYAYTSVLAESGRYTLENPPRDIFVEGDNIFAFYEGAAQPIDVEIVPTSLLTPPLPGAPVSPVGLAYQPDAIELGKDGTVYLLSIDSQSIFRWSIGTRSYLETIPLTGKPLLMAYSSITNRLYITYPEGRITQIRLDESISETPFATSRQRPIALGTAGEFVVLCDDSGFEFSHYTIHPDGSFISQIFGHPYTREYVWNPANRRMYFLHEGAFWYGIIGEDIDVDGVIGARKESYQPIANLGHPIRVAPDGSDVVLGSGRIYDAVTLDPLGTLSNAVNDAIWQGGTLFTLHGIGSHSEVQEWLPDYTPGDSFLLPGTPQRLFALGKEFLAITRVDGVPTFIVRPPGAWDSDGDGLDDDDELGVHGTDPLAVDTDGDGLTDREEVIDFGSNPTSPTQLWDLRGAATRRFGRGRLPLEVAASLLLNEDRTYVLKIDGEEVAERGAWFEDRNRIRLFSQNLLEQVQALEHGLSGEVGESVQLSLTRMSGTVATRTPSGTLSISAGRQWNVFMPQSAREERLSESIQLSGSLLQLAGAAHPRSEQKTGGIGAAYVSRNAVTTVTPPVPVGSWTLTGELGLKLGLLAGKGPLHGFLILMSDRTYILGSTAEGDEEGPPELGVWFQDQNRLLLIQQNLLEAMDALEKDLSQAVGEVAELALVSQQTQAQRGQAGALSLRESTRFNAHFSQSNVTLPLSLSVKGTGTPTN